MWWYNDDMIFNIVCHKYLHIFFQLKLSNPGVGILFELKKLNLNEGRE